MDIFRLPKMAAYFYRSQKPPDEEVVLHAATNWTMGDRSGGGNNPLIIFSNCDAVEILIDDRSYGRFGPDHESFPHLKHPPFKMQWSKPYNPWGAEFRDLTVKGYIGDELVATQQIAADHLPHELRLSACTDELKADGIDMVRVAVQIVDRFGNILPYRMQTVDFSLEGEADFIGENPLVLVGGQAACFIRSRHSGGSVTLHARTNGLPDVSITLQVEG
jgi:beta-galactosidase